MGSTHFVCKVLGNVYREFQLHNCVHPPHNKICPHCKMQQSPPPTNHHYTKWKAYILSIPDTDRRPHVENLKCELESRGIPTEILNGFYYKTTDVVSALYDRGITYDCPAKTLSQTQIGCFLSHRQAWERIQAETDPQVLSIIIEDDMALRDPTEFNLDYLLADINQQPIFHSLILWKHPAQMRENPTYQTPNLLEFYYQWGLCAYGISRELAAHLVESIKRFYIPVDQMLFIKFFPKFSNGIFMTAREHFENLGKLSSFDEDTKPFKSLIWT